MHRPVAVDHALGVTGSSARVAHRSSRLLIQLRPVERVRLRGKQLLVRMHLPTGTGQRGRGRRVWLGRRTSDYHVPDRGSVRKHLSEQRDQARVHDHDVVSGVVGDITDDLRVQPEGERMQDRTHRRNGQVRLEMLGVVPHQRGDPLVAVHAERPEGASEPGRPGAGLRVRLAADAVSRAGYHLAFAIGGAAEPHDSCHCQRDIHHRAAHRTSSVLTSPGLPDCLVPAGQAEVSLGWIVPRSRGNVRCWMGPPALTPFAARHRNGASPPHGKPCS